MPDDALGGVRAPLVVRCEKREATLTGMPQNLVLKDLAERLVAGPGHDKGV